MGSMKPATVVCVDDKTKICARYESRKCTHVFQVLGDITAEKVENMRTDPEMTGAPAVDLEPEAA
jgi:hypothetical protein